MFIVADAAGAPPDAAEYGQTVLDSVEPAPLASTTIVGLVTRLHRGDRHRRAVATALLVAPLLVAGTGLPAVAWTGAPAAAADGVAATRQQIAEVQAAVVSGAERVHALTAAYNQAIFEAATLDQEVAQARAQVSALQAQNAQVTSRLRQDAVDSYTGAYTGLPSVPPSGNGADLAVRAEYESVASGNLRDSMDRFRTTRRELSSAQAQLLVQQHQSGAALASVGQARQAALAEAVAEQGRLDSLQGRLTALVAAQQAAERSQTAALAAAAARATTQGLPVNGGLVAVVQAVVAPTPAPAAPVPAAPPTTLPQTGSTAPPAAPPASPAPTPGASNGDGGAGGVWLQLRECESGDDYQANTGNGYFGAYQFSQQTWADLGFPGRPDLEPPAMQDSAAQKLQAESGWSQWPACAAALGLS